MKIPIKYDLTSLSVSSALILFRIGIKTLRQPSAKQIVRAGPSTIIQMLHDTGHFSPARASTRAFRTIFTNLSLNLPGLTCYRVGQNEPDSTIPVQMIGPSF